MENAAVALYSGVRNITRMRKEIKTVLWTVGSALYTPSYTNLQFWEKCIRPPVPREKIIELGGQWSLDCSTPYSSGWRATLKFVDFAIYNFTGLSATYSEPPRNRVVQIYGGLDLFVQGMIREFPELGEILQPFFDAADA